MTQKYNHNAQYCKCTKCKTRRNNKKNGVNNDWQTFRGNAKIWHEQREKDEKKYNDLCGEVVVIKKEQKEKDA